MPTGEGYVDGTTVYVYPEGYPEGSDAIPLLDAEEFERFQEAAE